MSAQRAARARGGHTPARAFTPMANELVDDSSLDAYAFRVYSIIRRHDWRGEGWIFSYAELQATVGCGANRLREALLTLRARGLVRWEGIRPRPKRYFALPTRHDGAVQSLHSKGSIAPQQRFNRSTAKVQSLQDEGSFLITDDTQTIHRQDAAAQQRAAPPTQIPKSDGDEVTPEAVAAAILGAQGRPAPPAAVARMAPACTDEVTVPYRGQVTLAQIKACLVAMRRKKFFREKPHALTPRRLGEDLGPWLRTSSGADVPAPPEPAASCLCMATLNMGQQHDTARCGCTGIATTKNSYLPYRDGPREGIYER